MKKFFSALAETAYRVGGILLLLGGLWIAVIFGSFFLDLFGIRSYGPPLNQDPENMIRVELVDCSQKDMQVLVTLTDAEMDAFLEDFLKLKTKRYANDPPAPYGEIMVALYYADGCVDRIGNQMNTYEDTEGKPLSAGGWYYFPDRTLEALFEKYTTK